MNKKPGMLLLVLLPGIAAPAASSAAHCAVSAAALAACTGFQTPFDRIPKFAENPANATVASGLWSSGSIWSLGRPPIAGEVAAIASGHTVTYDLVSDAPIKAIGYFQ